MSSLVVDLGADPFVPTGLELEEHQKGEKFLWDPDRVGLYTSRDQNKGRVRGVILRSEVAGKNPFNACLLYFLLTNPGLIPDPWRYKEVFFWGTIYRNPSGLFVGSLQWKRGGQRRWYAANEYLGFEWNSNRPAAILIG